LTTLASDTWTGTDADPWGATWTTGSTPAGGSALIQGNAGRLTTGSAGGYAGADRVARRVDITAPVDACVLFRFRWPDGDECFPRFYVRSTNTALDTQGGYYVSLNRPSGNWSIGKSSAYTSTTLGTTVTYTFTSGAWYWVRFGVVGDAVKARVWADGASEPTTWDREVTDTTHTVAGSGCGFTVGGGALGQREFDVDDLTLDDVFPTVVEGSAALSTAAALSAAALADVQATAALSSAAALAAAALADVQASADLSTAATVTAAALADVQASAALATGSALAGGGDVTQLAGAGLSTASALTVTGDVEKVATAALTSGSVLSVVAYVTAEPDVISGAPTVKIRDAGYGFLGEASEYTALTIEPRHNDVGTWELVVPADADTTPYLLAANNPGGGIVVIRDGITLLSGPFRAARWSRNDDTGAGTYTITGVDDNWHLTTRTVYPQPTLPPESTTAVAYRPGPDDAESLMFDLVANNLGPAAPLTARRLAGLTLAENEERGPTFTAPPYRYTVLLEALQQLSVLSETGSDPTTRLGFRIVQDGNTLVFSVYNSVDRVDTARFSFEFGNLENAEWTSTGPTATYLVLGAGIDQATDGTRIAAQLFTYERTDTLYPPRVEQFVDVGTIDPAAVDAQDQLDQQASDTFDSAAGQTGVALTPVDTPRLRFGRDYGLGDHVSVTLPGLVSFTAPVRAVTLTYTAAEGERIGVAVGTTDGAYNRRNPGAYRRLSDIARYLRRLKTIK
jgi:hypothetical protein